MLRRPLSGRVPSCPWIQTTQISNFPATTATRASGRVSSKALNAFASVLAQERKAWNVLSSVVWRCAASHLITTLTLQGRKHLPIMEKPTATTSTGTPPPGQTSPTSAIMADWYEISPSTRVSDSNHHQILLLSPQTRVGLVQQPPGEPYADKFADDFLTASPTSSFHPRLYPSITQDGMMPIQQQYSRRVLTTMLVIAINFFLTCGGPSGTELAVVPAGPFIGLISMLAFPTVFSTPFAFVVAELCTAFPDDGGFVLWVKNAFGPFWGFQQGFWAWLSAVFCSAVYPMAIYSALESVYGDFASPFVQYLIKACLAILLSFPTLFGSYCASYLSVILIVLVMVPYAIFSIWSFVDSPDFGSLDDIREGNVTFVDYQTHQVVTRDLGSIDWMSLLTTVFWSYDGIYEVSLFGGQVSNPSYTYPRAIFGNLISAIICYLVPLVAVLAAGLQHWSEFSENSITIVAGLMGGSSLKNLLVFSTICSNAGLFSSSLFCTSYLLNGMSEAGLIPECFSRRHYFFQTPYISVLANVIPVLALLTCDFDVLVYATNAFSAIVQVMIIFAAIKLRFSHRDIHRPTKVPGGLVVFVLLMIIPLAVLMVVVFKAFTMAHTTVICAVTGTVGIVYGVVVFIYWPRHTHELQRFEVTRPTAAFY